MHDCTSCTRNNCVFQGYKVVACSDFKAEEKEQTMIKDSGNRREFDSGALRDMSEGKGRFDLMPWAALMEVAKHCENGAKKYGEHNVDKGIPTHSFMDSAVRHYLKYLRGDTDEPHDRAFVWNILCCIWTCIHKPELNDYAPKGESDNEHSCN